MQNNTGIAGPSFDATGRCAGAPTPSPPADSLVGMSIDEIGGAIRDAARGMSARLGYTTE
ncbi:hypothetical protein ACFSBZ_06405 [Amnibacterium flavum]|uniref:Uncharacterized protein n=1 Tax=Amnibacterium flavum TaxID=2173173 RepID=A0A2V1HUE3_9MICO|nr:hypothetical protein [Amnibacterium flavum]PVZ93917.1 hypothetical protein DDQ50_09085 [Amnibacterium flavum]